MTITGKFDVTLTPMEPHIQGQHGVNLGRMAIEQVEGSLEGKQGSFVLQHFGVMCAGENRLI